MDILFLDYDDPLFGIFIFLVIVLILAISSYWFGLFRNKEDTKDITSFVKRFEISSQDNYKEIFKNSNLTSDNIILLASNYDKLGEYDKSINLLLFILEKEKQNKIRQNILYLLGKVYFKAGFLQKAQTSFLNSLKLSAGDSDSLRYLSIIYEKELNFVDLFDVLESRIELDEDMNTELIYAQAYKIKYDKTFSLKQKIKEFSKIITKSKSVDRFYIEFLKANGLFNYKSIKTLDINLFIDIVFFENHTFFLKKIDNKIINAISFINGYNNKYVEFTDIFELEVLMKLKIAQCHKATLEFSYFCENCKNIFAISFTRCQKCHSLNTLQIQYKVVEDEL